MVLLLVGGSNSDDIGSRIARAANAIVLSMPREPNVDLEYAVGWLADHAVELGADPDQTVQLLVLIAS